MEFWDSNLILRVRRGSVAYGTNITKEMSKKTGLKESDEDFMGICIPPKEYLLGLKNFEQHEMKDPDETIYALRKFVNLAHGCNPNILEILFTSPAYTTHNTPWGKTLQDNRFLFLSKRAYHTFGGYAYAQSKKLTVKRENMTGRTDLAERFGYDTKFAMHLIRLLKMGIEILADGDLSVHRPEAAMLLDIRFGKYTLDEINEMAAELQKQLDWAYLNTKLPKAPATEDIHNLCVELHEDFWRARK